jgi:hypothetical protein
MAISIIRQFTDTDADRLNATALRFAARHGIDLQLDNENQPRTALDHWLWSCDTGTWPRITQLKRLWQACLCRALGVPVAADVTVAYGYVGRHA